MQTLQRSTQQCTTKSYQTYQNNSTYQNNNWLYDGTDEAWLYTDYSLPPYNISTEASTTSYKLPQYEEDLDCYNCKTPKTNAEILAELEALEPEFVEF